MSLSLFLIRFFCSSFLKIACLGDSIFPLSNGVFGHYVLLWTEDFLAFFFASFVAMLIVILSKDKGLELLEHESGIVQSPLKV